MAEDNLSPEELKLQAKRARRAAWARRKRAENLEEYNAKQRAYRAANKERMKILDKRAYEKKRKENLERERTNGREKSRRRYARLKALGLKPFVNKEYMREYQRAWRKKYRDHAIAYQKVYRAIHRLKINQQSREQHKRRLAAMTEDELRAYKQHRKEWYKKWFARHVGKATEYHQRYYERHREKVKEAVRRYNNTPKGRLVKQVSNHNRRARKKSTGVITLKQWCTILKVFRFQCFWCDKLLCKPADATMDHFVPLAKQGTHTPDNVVPACRSCNSRKNALLPEKFNPDRAKRKPVIRLNEDGSIIT